MKRIAVLIALIALIACTTNCWAMTGIYADPVDTITAPIHVEYGPGEQTITCSISIKAGGHSSVISYVTEIDTENKGDSLATDISIRNMKIKAGGKKSALDGTFLNVEIETDSCGKLIRQNFSSKKLNKEQIGQIKKSVEKTVTRAVLVNQEVATGSVMFSAQDELSRELLNQGFTLENFSIEYTLAGYVSHDGEKALLVKCEYPDGKLKHAQSGEAVDFGICSYMILRPQNLQYIYSETVMDVSIPGSTEKMKMSAVVTEK